MTDLDINLCVNATWESGESVSSWIFRCVDFTDRLQERTIDKFLIILTIVASSRGSESGQICCVTGADVLMER